MNLRIAENYQVLKKEVVTHWKTGAVITMVAITVGHIYGKTVMIGVVLLTVSNYQIIGRQIQILTWMNLRRTLIALVIFGNSYYRIINPQMMNYIAVSLILIDNFQLSSINTDLAAQNEGLKDNNNKLQEASKELQELQIELQKLVEPASQLQKAQEEHSEKVEMLNTIIPAEVQAIPARLHNLAALLKKLKEDPAMTEMLDYQDGLKKRISGLLDTFNGICKELQPLTGKVERLSASLTDTTAELKTNVVLTSRQVEVLQEAAASLRRIL